MIKARALGAVHYNFTNRETGEVVDTYCCYFGTADRGNNEFGLHIIKQYITTENFREWSLEGAFNTGKMVGLEYGEKGRLYNIEIQ